METMDLELKKVLDKYEYAGISVLHATKDGVKLLMSLGKQDIEEDIDVTEDTIYRIASVSKIIVALGAMKLVEEGKLDIYEDVSKYLGFTLRNPNHPDKKITLEQIMTQSSSITDGFDDPNKGYDAVNGPTMHVPLKEILTNPNYEYYNPKTFLKDEPGEKWLYSNFGCGILACIVEKVSGKLFTDYIKEILLDPLEIDGGFRAEQVVKKDMIASLYEYNDSGYKKIRTKDKFLQIMFPKYPIGDNFRGPAGGLFISAKDLSKIMIMMMCSPAPSSAVAAWQRCWRRLPRSPMPPLIPPSRWRMAAWNLTMSISSIIPLPRVGILRMSTCPSPPVPPWASSAVPAVPSPLLSPSFPVCTR